ncbi:unnamed protein product [Mytilus coruscus]|uniref:Uncharacterized protein n=1 Tax=Mytilus coruscus TaxID=42192 RepID=A0A6J8DET8_MYTCO|nr:unnamed protein product [Mytilus coruscus]
MLESLSEQITGIESKYLEKVDINSTLTLLNEQLHSMLRLKTEKPSVLDCARDFLRGVVECVKRVSLCGYHYFTSKKKSGYESPKQYLSLEQFPKFQRGKPSSVSKEDVKLLFEFRERYGKGVRQRSVRADTTKFNTDLSVTDIRINETAEDPSLTEPRTIDQLQSSNEPAGPVLDSIYDENDLVAVMLDDQLSLGSLTERVFETDKVCKAILYKENDGLEFHKDMQRDIPLYCILESVIPPLLPGQVVYTLDEEIYNRLTCSLQTNTMTINEKDSETFEEEEIVLTVLSCETTRRGRTVEKPRHLMDFY